MASSADWPSPYWTHSMAKVYTNNKHWLKVLPTVSEPRARNMFSIFNRSKAQRLLKIQLHHADLNRPKRKQMQKNQTCNYCFDNKTSVWPEIVTVTGRDSKFKFHAKHKRWNKLHVTFKRCNTNVCSTSFQLLHTILFTLPPLRVSIMFEKMVLLLNSIVRF